MTSMYLASPAYTMVDKSKGSMTNRYECAKEHFKNNFSANLKGLGLGVATGAGIVVAKKQPKVYLSLAKKLGELLGKSKTITKHLPDVMKRGKVGLAVAAGVALLTAATHITAKHSYKAGQIDQKYTDAAKIESQTKNIILEQIAAAKNEDARGFYSV